MRSLTLGLVHVDPVEAEDTSRRGQLAPRGIYGSFQGCWRSSLIHVQTSYLNQEQLAQLGRKDGQKIAQAVDVEMTDTSSSASDDSDEEKVVGFGSGKRRRQE